MFAARVAKPQANAAAGSTSNPEHQRSTLVAHRPGHSLVARLSNPPPEAPGGHHPPKVARVIGEARSTAWDFSKIPVFPSQRTNRLALPNRKTKLAIGQVNDPLEHEAERVADQVMHMPDPHLSIAAAPTQLSRKCAACEEEDGKLQKKPLTRASAAGHAPAIVHQALRMPGQPLSVETRAFMEPRFGQGFSVVRVHTDRLAADSATAIGARAYTLGRDIAFAPGEYAPDTPSGRQLLAHELTHVVQQREQDVPIVRRQSHGEGTLDAGTTPQDTPGAAASAADPDYSCPSSEPVCPSDFCQDVGTQRAEADRASQAEPILSDIGSLNSAAEPLFRNFVFNPGPAGDISSSHADAFTRATETLRTTEALKRELEKQLRDHPPAHIPPGGYGRVPLTAVLTPRAVRQFMECHLVFTDYTSVPGLIAGGVGKTQETDRRGRNTEGAVNDSRNATGTLEVSRGADGSFSITPDLTYHVVDTIDFCPGNCGGSFAQRLTIPLSQWEASGISGDVPFSVHFPAPSLVGAYGSEDA